MLPKARSDFRLPPEQYALDLENYGIDIPPEQLAQMAHHAFTEIQGEMKSIAAKDCQGSVNLPSSDYRDVIRELKKQQLVGDAILPFYENRLKQIEKIIVEHQIVTLTGPACANPHSNRRRNRAAARSAHGASAVPAQHGPEGRVRPAAEYSGRSGAGHGRSMTTSPSMPPAWTLTAHEARPGP